MTTLGVEEHDLFSREDSQPDTRGTLKRWIDDLMESRRYRDAEGRGPDPDSAPVTADNLERLVQRIIREQEPGFRMGDFHENKGDKKSWKDYLLGIVALVIMAWLTRISVQMDNVIKVVVKQEVDEKNIAELRCTVYKICQ